MILIDNLTRFVRDSYEQTITLFVNQDFSPKVKKQKLKSTTKKNNYQIILNSKYIVIENINILYIIFSI